MALFPFRIESAYIYFLIYRAATFVIRQLVLDPPDQRRHPRADCVSVCETYYEYNCRIGGRAGLLNHRPEKRQSEPGSLFSRSMTKTLPRSRKPYWFLENGLVSLSFGVAVGTGLPILFMCRASFWIKFCFTIA